MAARFHVRVSRGSFGEVEHPIDDGPQLPGVEQWPDVLHQLRLDGSLRRQGRRGELRCLKLGGARLWILDEPTTHLDAAGRDLVIDWIRRHADGGGCAVIATHQPDELARPGALVIEL